jgi:hypothetical protein
MSNSKPEPMLYLSDARGVYIPRDFAAGTRRDCVTGISDDDWQILSDGPDGEVYWDAWDAVCSDATVTDPDSGTRYTLYQDGDLWLVPEGMEFDEDRGFYWPEDSAEDCDNG